VRSPQNVFLKPQELFMLGKVLSTYTKKKQRVKGRKKKRKIINFFLKGRKENKEGFFVKVEVNFQ